MIFHSVWLVACTEQVDTGMPLWSPNRIQKLCPFVACAPEQHDNPTK